MFFISDDNCIPTSVLLSPIIATVFTISIPKLSAPTITSTTNLAYSLIASVTSKNLDQVKLIQVV